ncbi:hypothetical protein BLAT2472_11349 [Burkholderia latens]
MAAKYRDRPVRAAVRSARSRPVRRRCVKVAGGGRWDAARAAMAARRSTQQLKRALCFCTVSAP